MALFAVEMVVLGIAIVVFVNRPAIQFEFPQQTGIHEFSQGAIDGRTADVSGVSFGGQLRNKLVGIEMLVMAEDKLDQDPPLLGIPHPATLEVLRESLLRGKRDLNRA